MKKKSLFGQGIWEHLERERKWWEWVTKGIRGPYEKWRKEFCKVLLWVVNWIPSNFLGLMQIELLFNQNYFLIKTTKTKRLLVSFPFYKWEHWGLIHLGGMLIQTQNWTLVSWPKPLLFRKKSLPKVMVWEWHWWGGSPRERREGQGCEGRAQIRG